MEIDKVKETVHRLRAPGGCPWDREQTHQSLRPFLVEEAYEVLDVLDQMNAPEALQNPTTREAFKEELGDLLMQILLHSEMAAEVGAFTFEDVAQTLNEKLIRRHPHVFGETQVSGTGEVLANWEKIKAKEKADKASAPKSVLDGLPKGMPALQRAARVIEKVSRVGFQWPDMDGPLAKLDEEMAELKKEVQDKAPLERIEDELGDVLFCAANVAYLMKIAPEDALRKNLSKFERRFKHVEKRLAEKGSSPDQSTLAEMDTFWDEAKRLERGQ